MRLCKVYGVPQWQVVNKETVTGAHNEAAAAKRNHMEMHINIRRSTDQSLAACIRA